MRTTTSTASIGAERCTPLPCPLGRPQGLAFAPDGALHVVDALAGGSGVYRFRDLEAKPELVLSGTALVGVAFGPHGEMVVASNETAYRFEVKQPLVSHLFARKPISELQPPGDEAHSLRRVLGAGDLVMLAIGAVIGAGIFGAIGTAAAGQTGPGGEIIRYGAGPALIFSFLLLGGACALAALCYAELAAMIPQAGSAYAYAYATLGEVVAWIIGWDLILEYAVGNVAVAISWGDYFTTLTRGVGIDLPAWLTTGYRTALLSSNPDVQALSIRRLASPACR